MFVSQNDIDCHFGLKPRCRSSQPMSELRAKGPRKSKDICACLLKCTQSLPSPDADSRLQGFFTPRCCWFMQLLRACFIRELSWQLQLMNESVYATNTRVPDWRLAANTLDLEL